MVLDERGSESVQFSFAAVLLIVVAFGIMQMAMMNAVSHHAVLRAYPGVHAHRRVRPEDGIG